MTKREARKIVRIRLNEGINLTTLRERIVDIDVWKRGHTFYFKAITVTNNHNPLIYTGYIEQLDDTEYHYLEYNRMGGYLN